jgi:transposase-like protein
MLYHTQRTRWKTTENKKTLVLTLGSPLEKGRKKKTKTPVLTLVSARRKREEIIIIIINPGINHG